MYNVELQSRKMEVLFVECPGCGEVIEDLDIVLGCGISIDCPGCGQDLQILYGDGSAYKD